MKIDGACGGDAWDQQQFIVLHERPEQRGLTSITNGIRLFIVITSPSAELSFMFYF